LVKGLIEGGVSFDRGSCAFLATVSAACHVQRRCVPAGRIADFIYAASRLVDESLAH
jgi:hypothetical protein